MAKKMLVDATHPEETRVAIVDGQRLEDLDYEVASRKMLKGNIYLAKVIRIEPSLQAAFVEYGGNRHGFLAFSEIHPDYYRIPVGDRMEDDGDDEEAESDSFQFPTSQNTADVFEDGDESDTQTASDTEDFAKNNDDEHAARSAPLKIADSATDFSAQDDLAAQATAETVVSALQPISNFSDVNQSLVRDFSIAEHEVDDVDGPSMLVDVPKEETVDVIGGEEDETEQASETIRRQRRPKYKIQEVIKRRQVMLVQVVKEERGNKGAALTTYLSLAGRYCVLMPNTERGGGVSRKITNHADRRRMKDIMDQLELADGMAVILRTAGMEQEVADIQRDLDYLLRLWNNIREETLQSSAPALIYEEANLIKRSLRDLYNTSIDEILVAGQAGFENARNIMSMMIPESAERVKLYKDTSVPLFFRYQVENQIDKLHDPVVQLRSGGYLVINPTEALVSIDVNSGRSTRERHIESTALKTNLEAAEEIGRQLRLRDLAGLVVVDFIDMEDGRNNTAVERRIKDAMKHDRARLQIGRISHFGLLELSRQRLRPSLLETSFTKCSHCAGLGLVRLTESLALSVLRSLEEEGLRTRGNHLSVQISSEVALYILNYKREALNNIQKQYNLHVSFEMAAEPTSEGFKIDRLKRPRADAHNQNEAAVDSDSHYVAAPVEYTRDSQDEYESDNNTDASEQDDARGRRGGRRRNRRGRGGQRTHESRHAPREMNNTRSDNSHPDEAPDNSVEADAEHAANTAHDGEDGQDSRDRRRRRGRRGGRRRNHRSNEQEGMAANGEHYEANGNTFKPQGGSASEVHYSPSMHIPLNVQDIDTTPREYDKPRQTAPRSDSAPPPYQVIEQTEGGENRSGWWRRLTGK